MFISNIRQFSKDSLHLNLLKTFLKGSTRTKIFRRTRKKKQQNDAAGGLHQVWIQTFSSYHRTLILGAPLVIDWFQLRNVKMFQRRGSSEHDSRARDDWMTWAVVSVQSRGHVKLSKVKGVYAWQCMYATAYSISSNTPLKLLMCYMITSTACQLERWLWRLRGIILWQPHYSYLFQWFPLLTRRWQTKMFSVYNAFLATCPHISNFPLMWLPAKSPAQRGVWYWYIKVLACVTPV